MTEEQLTMTEQQFLNKFDSLLPAVVDGLKQRAKSAVLSGVLDIGAEGEDSFYLAKALLCATLAAEVGQWRPLGGITREEKYIKQFV